MIVIKGLGLGGAEKLIVESARHWDRAAFEYEVAVLSPLHNELADQLQALGVEVLMPRESMRFGPATLLWLRGLIRSRRPDLIHAHLPLAGVMARLVRTCPVVYTEHNVTGSYHPLTRLVNRLTYRRNDYAIAVSDAVAGSIAGYPARRIGVVSNGVWCAEQPEAAREVRVELGLDPQDPLVVHVGNIRSGKGHWDLIEAAKVVLAALPNAMVVSIGAEQVPGELTRLRQAATDGGIGARLLFLGMRKDALSFTGAADVFVNPSHVEGLPLAVLEAMALRRPVVATRAGGVPEVIRDMETGLLVDAGRPRTLAEAVLRLLGDPELALTLSAAAGALVDEEYGLSKNVTAVENIYRSVFLNVAH